MWTVRERGFVVVWQNAGLDREAHAVENYTSLKTAADDVQGRNESAPKITADFLLLVPPVEWSKRKKGRDF
jgi:hypothetical protein